MNDRARRSRFLLVSACLGGPLLFLTLACTADEQESGTHSPVEASGAPRWPLPSDPSALVEAAGLDLGPMGMAEHYHPRLRVVLDGEAVLVPAGIGVDPATGAMSAVHTHTPDGEIHVEAEQTGQRFTLGQVFTQWAVPLTRTRIGDVNGTIEVTVNGTPYEQNPASLRLAPEQEIVLRVATE